MTYDHWKTTDRGLEEIGPDPEDEDEEEWEKWPEEESIDGRNNNSDISDDIGDLYPLTTQGEQTI